MYQHGLRYRIRGKRIWIAVPSAWGYLLEVWETTQGDSLESLDHLHSRRMDVMHVAASLAHFTPDEIERLSRKPIEMVLLPYGGLDPRYPDQAYDDEITDYYISDISWAWRRRGYRRHYRERYWPRLSFER